MIGETAYLVVRNSTASCHTPDLVYAGPIHKLHQHLKGIIVIRSGLNPDGCCAETEMQYQSIPEEGELKEVTSDEMSSTKQKMHQL